MKTNSIGDKKHRSRKMKNGKAETEKEKVSRKLKKKQNNIVNKTSKQNEISERKKWKRRKRKEKQHTRRKAVN
jgi:hypothetical protein